MKLKTIADYPDGFDNNLTPEHNKRNIGGGLSPEVEAAYAYVSSVYETSDYSDVHVWNGWALREAFLAGISYE